MTTDSETLKTEPRRRRLTPELAFIALIALVVAATLGLIIVTLNRGFDWSDEAFVYTMISSDRSGPAEFWGFQHLLHPIYELFGSSVLAFRVLRLIGYVVLGLLLTYIANKVLGSLGISVGRSSWVVIALLAQVGTFTAWSYPPRYLGYNELSSWFAQLGGALLLFLLVAGATEPASRKARLRIWLLWALVGALIAMMLFAKVTAAILFFCLALIVAVVPSAAKGPLRRLGVLLGGTALTLVVMIVSGLPVLEYVQHIADLLLNPSAREASGYSLSDLMVTYLHSASQTARALAIPVILATYVLLISSGVFCKSLASHDLPALRSSSVLENIAVALAVLLALILLLPSTLSTWDKLGNANTFMFCVAVLAFAVALPSASSRADDGRSTSHSLVVSVGVLLFAMIPFVNAVGTNNAIFGQTVFSASLWAVGAGVGLCILWERSSAGLRIVRFLPVMVAGAIVALSGYSVVADVFVDPYRTAPYLSQKSPVTSGDLRGMLLAEGEPEMFEWMREAGLRENAASVPAIATAFPDRLLGFNASGWASPWPGPDWQASIERACASGAPEDLFVLESHDDPEGSTRLDKLNAGLEVCEIHFPTDFKVVDKYDDGADGRWNTTIWRLK